MRKLVFRLALLAITFVVVLSISSCDKDNGNSKVGIVMDNSDVLSGTKWMFVRYDDAPVNYMYVKMTFTQDGNIQMPFLTLPYVEDGSAISVSYPESTRSHRFILSNDGQSLKILDNFHIFSDTQDIWDTTYFERRN